MSSSSRTLYGYIVVIKRDGSDGARFPMKAKEITIGRALQNSIQIALDSVSAKHASLEIDPENNEMFIINHSQNGTKLNNENIAAKTNLSNGDVFTCINRSFRVEFAVDFLSKSLSSRSSSVNSKSQLSSIENILNNQPTKTPSKSILSKKPLSSVKKLIKADDSKPQTPVRQETQAEKQLKTTVEERAAAAAESKEEIPLEIAIETAPASPEALPEAKVVETARVLPTPVRARIGSARKNLRPIYGQPLKLAENSTKRAEKITMATPLKADIVRKQAQLIKEKPVKKTLKTPLKKEIKQGKLLNKVQQNQRIVIEESEESEHKEGAVALEEIKAAELVEEAVPAAAPVVVLTPNNFRAVSTPRFKSAVKAPIFSPIEEAEFEPVTPLSSISNKKSAKKAKSASKKAAAAAVQSVAEVRETVEAAEEGEIAVKAEKVAPELAQAMAASLKDESVRVSMKSLQTPLKKEIKSGHQLKHVSARKAAVMEQAEEKTEEIEVGEYSVETVAAEEAEQPADVEAAQEAALEQSEEVAAKVVSPVPARRQSRRVSMKAAMVAPPLALPTPIKAAIVEKQAQLVRAKPAKKALATPLRKAIKQGKLLNKVSAEEVTTESQETVEESTEQTAAAQQTSQSPAKLPSPVRRQLSSGRKHLKTLGEQRRALDTPLKKEIRQGKLLSHVSAKKSQEIVGVEAPEAGEQPVERVAAVKPQRLAPISSKLAQRRAGKTQRTVTTAVKHMAKINKSFLSCRKPSQAIANAAQNVMDGLVSLMEEKSVENSAIATSVATIYSQLTTFARPAASALFSPISVPKTPLSRMQSTPSRPQRDSLLASFVELICSPRSALSQPAQNAIDEIFQGLKKAPAAVASTAQKHSSAAKNGAFLAPAALPKTPLSIRLNPKSFSEKKPRANKIVKYNDNGAVVAEIVSFDVIDPDYDSEEIDQEERFELRYEPVYHAIVLTERDVIDTEPIGLSLFEGLEELAALNSFNLATNPSIEEQLQQENSVAPAPENDEEAVEALKNALYDSIVELIEAPAALEAAQSAAKASSVAAEASGAHDVRTPASKKAKRLSYATPAPASAQKSAKKAHIIISEPIASQAKPKRGARKTAAPRVQAAVEPLSIEQPARTGRGRKARQEATPAPVEIPVEISAETEAGEEEKSGAEPLVLAGEVVVPAKKGHEGRKTADVQAVEEIQTNVEARKPSTGRRTAKKGREEAVLSTSAVEEVPAASEEPAGRTTRRAKSVKAEEKAVEVEKLLEQASETEKTNRGGPSKAKKGVEAEEESRVVMSKPVASMKGAREGRKAVSRAAAEESAVAVPSTRATRSRRN
jgi:pSer/pThr/pTyr-binding forkhead associated (FHA) protein